MSTKCQKIEQGYKTCKHSVDKFKKCDIDHENIWSKRKECYESAEGDLPTTQRAPNLPGKCPECLAKESGWDCCKCETSVPSGSVCDNPDCKHPFCFDCDPAER